MRTHLIFWVVGLCACGSGCSLAVTATRNLALEMSDAVEDCREAVQARQLARKAWDTVRQNSPRRTYSRAYAAGFKDGFAHSLNTVGAGPVFPIPPPQYRQSGYPVPQDRRDLEDWLAGFHHGATAAQGAQQKGGITLPVPASSPPSVLHGQAKPPAAPPVAGPKPGPVLPPPRKVAPKTNEGG